MTIEQYHFVDLEGNPAGGHTSGVGIDITWQNGPLSVDGERREPNGAFVEHIIEAAIGRLEFYQDSKFASVYNEGALAHLQKAMEFLNQRTKDREDRGVEGTHQL